MENIILLIRSIFNTLFLFLGVVVVVIIIAAIVGTFVPILLNKRGIDPAIATGPFITTSNDIFGILIFFYISKFILGF